MRHALHTTYMYVGSQLQRAPAYEVGMYATEIHPVVSAQTNSGNYVQYIVQYQYCGLPAALSYRYQFIAVQLNFQLRSIIISVSVESLQFCFPNFLSPARQRRQ